MYLKISKLMTLLVLAALTIIDCIGEVKKLAINGGIDKIETVKYDFFGLYCSLNNNSNEPIQLAPTPIATACIILLALLGEMIIGIKQTI